MSRTTAVLWSLAVLLVAALNILDILPDAATYAAVLTLPLVAITSGRCLKSGRQSEEAA